MTAALPSGALYVVLSQAVQTHVIKVGLNGSTYDPSVTFAQPGDIVTFAFYPTNFSVIKAESARAPTCPSGGCNPCVPWELYHPNSPNGGFHSGSVLTTNYVPDQVSECIERMTKGLDHDSQTCSQPLGAYVSTTQTPSSSIAMR